MKKNPYIPNRQLTDNNGTGGRDTYLLHGTTDCNCLNSPPMCIPLSSSISLFFIRARMKSDKSIALSANQVGSKVLLGREYADQLTLQLSLMTQNLGQC